MTTPQQRPRTVTQNSDGYHLTFYLGTSIEQAATIMVDIANRYNCEAFSDFNHAKLYATPSTPQQLIVDGYIAGKNR